MDTTLDIDKDTVPREKHILTPIQEPTSWPPFIDVVVETVPLSSWVMLSRMGLPRWSPKLRPLGMCWAITIWVMWSMMSEGIGISVQWWQMIQCPVVSAIKQWLPWALSVGPRQMAPWVWGHILLLCGLCDLIDKFAAWWVAVRR